MSDEVLDPALQLQDTTEEFDRLLQLRKIAQDAFVKLSSAEAASKALRARSRPQRIFKVGDIVYVYRLLRKKKSVKGVDVDEVKERGAARKATWVGPGHVLAIMEGSVVWINMLGELWRAAVEQVREATTMERLGVEVIAEGFSEMQERLKRSAHRSGYRDVTGDLPEDVENPKDEVDEEGRRRGIPRVRFAEELQQDVPAPTPTLERAESEEELYPSPSPFQAPDEPDADEGIAEEDGREERRGSRQTVQEPLEEPNAADLEELRDAEAERVAEQSMVSSVAASEALDGNLRSEQAYDAVRRSVHRRWKRRQEKPYFAEFFLMSEEEEKTQIQEEKPTQDYWVYDAWRQKLQRHHVQWRKSLFNLSQALRFKVPFHSEHCGELG